MLQSPALTKAIAARRKARKLKLHSPTTFHAAANGDTTAKTTNITPWGEPKIPHLSSIYKTPPLLGKFPLGTHDPIQSRNWRIMMDMYLRQSHYAAALVTGRREHPWTDHTGLHDLGRQHFNEIDWVFDPTTTATTLLWVAEKNPTLAGELDELLHFGDIVSWASLQDAIYSVIYRAIGTQTRWETMG